ncbi:MAG: wax ester/triacylglycerol synthase family O-acyltransferase [Myxococcales bacterium]|nr:wax ester/triacylglycerol synthase family O-acyltransferase [Myxococcales bacterium]
MQQLSGMDASFVYMESPTHHLTVAGFALVDPSTAPRGLTFLDFRDFIVSRLHLVPVLRRRLLRVPLDLDHPYWVDDPDFDPDVHLHHLGLPPPAGHAELMSLFARLISRPLDLRRPPWEMSFIEGITGSVAGYPPGAVAVVFKFHHSAVDGVSAGEILQHLFDMAPEGREIEPPAESWAPKPIPSDVELLARATGHGLATPMKAMELVPKLFGSVRDMGRELIDTLKDQEAPTLHATAPKAPWNATISAQRAYDAVSIPLEDVKAIKRAVEGATVNDVILAICAGALRRYLAARGTLPDEPLRAVTPVSVRTPEQMGTMGNKVSVMPCGLATDEKDPLERLRRIHDDMAQSKRVHGALDTQVLMEATRFLPALMGPAARLYTRFHTADRTRPFANAIITNVPGPPFPLYMAGGRILAQFGSGPILDNLGLLIAVFSYDGRVTLGVTACRKLVPDVEDLTAGLSAGVDELTTAVGLAV